MLATSVAFLAAKVIYMNRYALLNFNDVEYVKSSSAADAAHLVIRKVLMTCQFWADSLQCHMR